MLMIAQLCLERWIAWLIGLVLLNRCCVKSLERIILVVLWVLVLVSYGLLRMKGILNTVKKLVLIVTLSKRTPLLVLLSLVMLFRVQTVAWCRLLLVLRSLVTLT